MNRMSRLTAVAMVSGVAAILVASGCGTSGSAPGANGASSSAPAATASYSSQAPATTPAETTPPETSPAATAPAPSATKKLAPVYRSSVSTLDASTRRRMTGVSWHAGCPVGLNQLRLLRVSYLGFDHAVHQGELVVNASAATALSRAFGLLFSAGFPIRQMRLVDDFGGDDERSMLADNTSAFNCRQVPGTTVWAQHAYGLAVDVNPFENPEVRGGAIDPPAASAWADRTRSSPAMIDHGDAAWRAFDEIGWPWGGDWHSLKDYMHFSANGL